MDDLDRGYHGSGRGSAWVGMDRRDNLLKLRVEFLFFDRWNRLRCYALTEETSHCYTQTFAPEMATAGFEEDTCCAQFILASLSS